MSDDGGFTIDQLMELAGLSVSQAGMYDSSTRPVQSQYGLSEVENLLTDDEQSTKSIRPPVARTF